MAKTLLVLAIHDAGIKESIRICEGDIVSVRRRGLRPVHTKATCRLVVEQLEAPVTHSVRSDFTIESVSVTVYCHLGNALRGKVRRN
jgi:hypothetical protein